MQVQVGLAIRGFNVADPADGPVLLFQNQDGLATISPAVVPFDYAATGGNVNVSIGSGTMDVDSDTVQCNFFGGAV